MPADVSLNIDVSKKGSGDEEAALGLEALARAAENAEDHLDQLDRKLLETRAAMVAAGKTFQETGDISPLKALLKDEKQLSSVQKSVERGVKAIDQQIKEAADQGGQGFITRFGHAVENGIASLPTPQGFVQWLVAGAVVASPLIGAAINAGVLLGVGSGGIALGLAGAAQDERVRAAYADLGGFAKQELISASTGFIAPAIEGAHQIKQSLAGLGPALKGDLDAVAPSLNHLIDGVTGFVEQMQAHGLGDAFQAAKPVIDALANELPGMGQAMGDFFHDIAAGGPGAVQFMHDFATGIKITVASTGALIEGLSKAYDFLINNPIGKIFSGVGIAEFEKLSHSSDKSTKSLAELNAEGYQASLSLDALGKSGKAAGLGAEVSSEDFKKLAQQISATGSTTDVLAGKITDRLVNGMLSLDQASLGMNQALLQVHDSFVQNGKQLDIVTAKGEANRSAVLAAVSANLRQYDALIQSGVGAQDAARAYDQNTAALEHQLRQAGLTQAQVDGLIGKYRQVPGKVNTDIQLEGVTQAINNLSDILARVNHLDGYVAHASVVVTEDYVANRSSVFSQQVPKFRWGGITEHAAAGLLRDAQVFSAVSRGARYAFAEPGTGGEAFVPKHGDPARSLGILSQAAGWYGAQVVRGGRGGYGGVPLGSGGGAGAATLRLVVTADGGAGASSAEQGLVDFVHHAIRMGWLQLKADPNSGYQVKAG